MKKVSLAVTVICLLWVLTGCGNSVPKEEPQSFANMESAEVSEGSESEGQSDEIQSGAGESSGLHTGQEEQGQMQSDQQVHEPVEGSGLESEEMSILM